MSEKEKKENEITYWHTNAHNYNKQKRTKADIIQSKGQGIIRSEIGDNGEKCEILEDHHKNGKPFYHFYVHGRRIMHTSSKKDLDKMFDECKKMNWKKYESNYLHTDDEK